MEPERYERNCVALEAFTQAQQRLTSILRGKPRAVQQETVATKFVDVAKRRLDPTVYDDIMAEAKA